MLYEFNAKQRKVVDYSTIESALSNACDIVHVPTE